jgi:hypothetical protein
MVSDREEKFTPTTTTTTTTTDTEMDEDNARGNSKTRRESIITKTSESLSESDDVEGKKT